MTQKNQLELQLPEINWGVLEEEGVPEEKVREIAEEVIPGLFIARLLRSERRLLTVSTYRKVREIERKLSDWREKYVGVRSIIRTSWGKEILIQLEGCFMKTCREADFHTKGCPLVAKDRPFQKAESNFSLFRFMVGLAEEEGLLREYRPIPGGKGVPREIRELRVPLYDPKTRETRVYQPVSWKSDLQKEVARALRDFGARCREAYRAQKEAAQIHRKTEEQEEAPPSNQAQEETPQEETSIEGQPVEASLNLLPPVQPKTSSSSGIVFREELEAQGKLPPKGKSPKKGKRSSKRERYPDDEEELE